MKIKLSLRRSGLSDVDLLVTVDVTAKVGDLADYLARADPAAKTPAAVSETQAVGARTLQLLGASPLVLHPGLAVGDSGLRSGATVGVARSSGLAAPGASSHAAVVLVTAGPDRGREFALPQGISFIGRDGSCAVKLTDLSVSRRHAKIVIGDVAEVVDLGSAHGLQVDDCPVERSVLRPGDLVRLGDTELTVRVAPALGPGVEAVAEGFIRSPRLDRYYPGEEFTAPEPPKQPSKTRMPVIPLVTPVVLGAVIYLMTRSATSLIFVALSPLMTVGYAVESRLAGRSAYRGAVEQFRAGLAELTAQCRQAAAREITARGREHPSLAECVDAVWHGSPLLWSRRPGERGFAEVRLGLGRRPARTSIALPDQRGTDPRLYAELLTATEPFGHVDRVPVVAGAAGPAGDGSAGVGAIGLAGPPQIVLSAARALVLQSAALHSPAELVVTAFASPHSAKSWDWLKWLPHTTSPQSPLTKRHLAVGTADTIALISELEELLARRSTDEAGVLPMVLVIVEGDTPVERSRLVELAERGAPLGIHVLWLAADITLLPAACRAFVTLTHDSRTGIAGFLNSGESVEPLETEALDEPTALELARRLARLVDIGARVNDASDLPRSVALMAVSDPPLTASPEAVIERWADNQSIVTGPYSTPEPTGAASGGASGGARERRKSRKPGTLRAVIGQSATGPHILDLRADGPHALVGGTTGSGKSELLQSWILGMAIEHSPERLTFLLVDYKGGSAFNELRSLPHTVGFVTDLDDHLVVRVLTSLAAELRRREQFFAKYRAKDLVDLEVRGVRDAPPSLVIVVDEFAALVKELPEFVDGVIDVAQRGRSLGVHLILATQRPAGVIKENLRANTNLRVALRTADEDDSLDVLGSREAAFFDSALQGRAVSKTGPGRLIPFQTGYVGGWTTDKPPPPEIRVEELRFGAGAPWLVEQQEQHFDPEQTDVRRLVAAVGSAQIQARTRRPRSPWLPELKSVYDLAELADPARPGRRVGELVFGVGDEPSRQAQPTVSFRPDKDGHLVVYGTGGSGKSVLLRTLAVSVGFNLRDDPCWVYGLDFGARGLTMLKTLPYVGAVVTASEDERVTRLLSWLSVLVAERTARNAEEKVGTITDYRAVTGVAEPRILLLLDGIASLPQAYGPGGRPGWLDTLCTIAANGRPAGVHLLVTADRPASVPSAPASAIQARIVLRMADPLDYSPLGLTQETSRILKPTSPPGRGILGSVEFQVAVVGTASDVGSQASKIQEFADALVADGVRHAPAIRVLSKKVPLDSLPESVDGRPVIGVASDTLEAHPFEPAGSFLVSGPAKSGRTETLHALAVSLRRWDKEVRLYYFGNERSRLASLKLWNGTACTAQEAVRLADNVTETISSLPRGANVALFIEDVADFARGVADVPLTKLAVLCRGTGAFVVGEGETTTLFSGAPGLLGEVKFSRTGLALAPGSAEGDQLFRTTFPPRLARADFPPGRALFVTAGKASVVQVGHVGDV
jgi:S-DNA-T family DNA segregation ATPase FtsK/SpoIIIE